MNDMTHAIVPKSDQLNSDDLIAGPITIRISGVKIKPGTEQPVAISFEGDNGKPWKPCKSMSRVMVAAWGPDAGKYAGRSLTLYRDPAVKWAGMEVGGIRISHMTDIATPLVMALTATKGSRKPFTVQPLKAAAAPAPAPEPKEPEVTPEDKAAWLKLINNSANLESLRDNFRRAWNWAKDPLDEAAQTEIKAAYDTRLKVFS